MNGIGVLLMLNLDIKNSVLGIYRKCLNDCMNFN